MPVRNDRGFTLIELMVTVLILGILSTVALPAFRAMIVGQRVKTASFDTMAMLMLTRSEAIKRNTTVWATPTNCDWAQGWTISATAPAGCVPNVPNGPISAQAAMPGIRASCLSGGVAAACDSIWYNSSGRIGNAASPAIQLESSDNDTAIKPRCISIDLSGRPKSKMGTCP